MQVLFDKIKDRDYFNRHYPEVKRLLKYAAGGQILSFATEAGIFYGVMFPTFQAIAPRFAILTCFVLSVFGAFLLEGMLRATGGGAARSMILPGSWARKNIDITLFNWLLFFAVAIICGFASFKYVQISANNLIPPPTLETPAPIEANRNRDVKQIFAIYKTDSTATAASYAGQILTKKAQHKSRVNVNNSKINFYQQKQRGEGVAYTTKINWFKRKNIASAATLANEIATLKEKEAAALNILLIAKNEKYNEKDKSYAGAIAALDISNSTAKDTRNVMAANVGGGLGWFTVFCLCFLLFAIYRKEKVLYHSGVEFKTAVSQHEFNGNIFADFTALAFQKIDYSLRNRLYTWAAKGTPTEKAPPIPYPIAPIFEGLSQDQIVLNYTAFNKKAKANITATIPIAKVKKQKQNKPKNTTPTQQKAKVKSALELIAQAKSKSKSGIQKIGNSFVIEHVGQDRQGNEKKKYYKRFEVVSITGNYKKALKKSSSIPENDRTDKNRKTINNRTLWVQYWEGRLSEFDQVPVQ